MNTATRALLLSLCVLTVPLIALGQSAFQPLVPDIPFIGNADWTGRGFTGLLQALIGISVGLAAVLAVVMLAVGGFKYMTTDSAFRLGDAKEQIVNAIVGLLIVLTAVLILNTINPQLTSLDVFRGINSYRSGASTGPAPSSPAGGAAAAGGTPAPTTPPTPPAGPPGGP